MSTWCSATCQVKPQHLPSYGDWILPRLYATAGFFLLLFCQWLGKCHNGFLGAVQALAGAEADCAYTLPLKSIWPAVCLPIFVLAARSDFTEADGTSGMSDFFRKKKKEQIPQIFHRDLGGWQVSLIKGDCFRLSERELKASGSDIISQQGSFRNPASASLNCAFRLFSFWSAYLEELN